jgi:hypothetical protein
MPRARFHDGRPGRYRQLKDESRTRAEAYGQIEEPEGPNKSRVSMSLADAAKRARELKAFKENVQKTWPSSRGCHA